MSLISIYVSSFLDVTADKCHTKTTCIDPLLILSHNSTLREFFQQKQQT